MNSADHIADLLLKHRKDELTLLEEIALTKWRVEKPENEELFQQVNDDEWFLQMLRDVYYFKEKGWKELVKKAKELGYDLEW